MTMPNFLIVGAAKSGTTSLYYYLRQHPQVFMSPQKETNFFAYENRPIEQIWWGEEPAMIQHSVTDLAAYRRLFQGVTKETAIGEASPLYLYSPIAAANIARRLPDARLIAILRNPVDRAFSHFSHLRRDNREPIADFARALAAETARMGEGWLWDYYYRDLGLYGKQVERYFDYFDRRQMHFVLYEDLEQQPDQTMKVLFAHVGVDTHFEPDTAVRHNPSGMPRSRQLHHFLTGDSFLKTAARETLPRRVRQRIAAALWARNLDNLQMDPATREVLKQDYRQDILKLQTLIERDLSAWLA